MIQYNLNVYNGLPSNHVYTFLEDRNGYLWIATERGIVKYNGYQTKLFNTTNGLPNEDVWGILEDDRGRIWVSSIAMSLGYIQHDIYNVVQASKKYPIYPQTLVAYDSGIIYATPYTPTSIGLFIERDNRIKLLAHSTNIIVGSDKVVMLKGGIEDSLYVLGIDDKKVRLKRVCYIPQMKEMLQWPLGTKTRMFNKYAVIWGQRKKPLFINLTDCSCTQLDINEHDFLSVQEPVNRNKELQYLHLMYEGKIERRDAKLNVVEDIPVINLVQDKKLKGYNLTRLYENTFWGYCLGTESNGAYITQPYNPPFKKIDWDVTNYKYLGAINDTTGYWWNNYTKRLARVSGPTAKVTSQRYDSLQLLSMAQYNSDTSVLMGSGIIYSVSHNGGHLRRFSKASRFHKTRGGIIKGNNRYFLQNYGIAKERVGDTLQAAQVIDSERYTGIAFANSAKWICFYNDHKILFYKNDKQRFVFQNEQLTSIGIDKIESIVISNNGRNVVLKTSDALYSINTGKWKRNRILNNVNLKDAKIIVNDSIIIAAGKFGLAFIKKITDGELSQPVIVHNIRGNNYAFLNEVQLLGKSVLITTDSGGFIVAIPPDSSYLHPVMAELPYKFILQYRDTSRILSKDDTIRMEQSDRQLKFDIVRPAAYGKLKFKFCIKEVDNNWQYINADELNTSNLEPAKYYLMRIKAEDDVWISSSKVVFLYIKPYWWQTSSGSKILWLTIVSLILVVLAVTVIITRKVIVKNNIRRNHELELELKALHSQINPHFIFNTLNSALFFIKKQRLDDAYNHIMRFSSLLRAYLQSARNRYITLEEEIINLRNYIELQQTRFGNTFTYDITLQNIEVGDKIFIPTLLLQPIVENAINHGLLPKTEPGHLSVKFIKVSGQNNLICIIEDNGIGRERSKLSSENNLIKKESYGDKLIMELVGIFNKYEKAGIAVEYIDKEEPEEGTIVKITINNPGNNE